MARRKISKTKQAATLRAEAHVLTLAGAGLLALGFPFTMALVAQALSSGAVSPFAPVAAGAPIVLAGYFACHVASLRLVKANGLARPRAKPRARLAASAQNC